MKYVNKKQLLKPQIFIFFSEALLMCTQITNRKTDNSAA